MAIRKEHQQQAAAVASDAQTSILASATMTAAEKQRYGAIINALNTIIQGS